MIVVVSIGDHYNSLYASPKAFQYSRWVYGPFIRELLRYSHLGKGSRILDVGCGQGFFSQLLAEGGMQVEGVDASETGIDYARKNCPSGTFDVGDALVIASQREPYDAIFCRAFSPYNTSDVTRQRDTTSQLLRILRPDGVLIWLYNSRLQPQDGQSWRQHTLTETRHQFEPFKAKVFLSLRVDSRVLGLGSWQSRLNEFLVKHSRVGAELVAFVRRSA